MFICWSKITEFKVLKSCRILTFKLHNMEKTGKKTKKWNPSLHTRFKKWHIPTATSQQKKEWRVRRRQAQELMRDLIALSGYTSNELKVYLSHKKGEILVKEYILIRYCLTACKWWKTLVDWINMFVPYPY